MKKTSLPLLSTANQLLAEFIPILTVSYHPVIKLACYIHYYIDVSGFARIGLSFNLELIKSRDVFKNNGYPENFINNCVKVFLANKYRVREKSDNCA